MKWENTFLVFEVSKGPKVIIESLDNYGNDGWETCSMLLVAGNQIVAFLKRKIGDAEPKENKEEQKIAKLWSADGK